MKRHPKQAYGIFHDGLAVRMVQLAREGKDVFLQAVDQTELDRYWYKIQEDGGISEADAKAKEEKPSSKSDIQIEEFDSDYITNYQLLPSERMLASFDLQHGVIALNVYDENILKDSFGAVSKKEMEQFVKSKVPSKQLKTGEWQSAIVTIGGQKQHWLHKGTNRLLDLLRDFQRTNRLALFYQLADANDIALTDYFKISYDEFLADKTALLVYLGQEYRKAFVFKNGEWVETLKLQITQNTPDAEVISSKLSLAIDNAGLGEPEAIILCGDLTSSDLVEYMQTQFPNEKIEQLSFRHLTVSTQDSESFDPRSLNQFTIPIALAYKALFPDEARFTPSNFLPPRIVEGQKVFKIAWHGFMVLFLIFVVALVATNSIMKEAQTVRTETSLKRDLDFQLEVTRKAAAEIQKIRNELEAQDKTVDVLKSILDNQNPWTEVLSIGNKTFAGQPLSWLNNLKKDKEELFLAGVTTRRAGIIEFANAFPDSKIRKVIHSKIRGKSVWNFELTSAIPKVDWTAMIDEDVQYLLSLKESVGEEQQKAADAAAEKQEPGKPAKLIAPQRVATKKTTDKRGRIILPLLPQSSCPTPQDELTTGEGEDIQAYLKFVVSINRGNIWEYRDMGQRFITRYRSSQLLPAVRWWMSYRLYLDKEYILAKQYLEPMLESSDRYQPYSLLLQARIDYASGGSRYKEFYNLLKNDYGRHSLMAQVAEDLSLIDKGDGK
ncbi:MAG: hypothetical protein PHO32_05635 [Candidatus Cloacimonetes bacterium]|nr:hypothetical protein [Candidatus Cloacimonadota bacterium]